VNKLSAPLFYLAGQAASSLLRTMSWVVLPVYYVLAVHMNPLQLVLLGTIFELTIFLFGVPTGVAADVYGRRFSVTVGWALLGCALLLQGLVHLFAVVAVAQVVDGLGESCADGAWAAWLADEVGEERFGPLLTRGAQVGQLGAFFGMIGGALLAADRSTARSLSPIGPSPWPLSLLPWRPTSCWLCSATGPGARCGP